MTQLLRLRSAPKLFSARDFRADRDNLVLRDVVAMQANVEVIGYEVETDLKTLHIMAKLGNARKQGVRQRFGHPGVSENAMGKKLGVARSFRVVGDLLRHDTHFFDPARLSPSFNGMDPIEYIFQMAEQHPEELAESVVMEADAVWVLDDGREVPRFVDERRYAEEEKEGIARDENRRPLRATTRLPIVRPTKFWYVDYVNEGAATPDGMFGVAAAEMAASLFSGTTGEYAQEVFDLVDRWREAYGISLEEVPRKVNQVMSRYLYTRGIKENGMPTKRKLQLEDAGVQSASLEQVTAPAAELVQGASQAELSSETGQGNELDTVLARAEARVEEQVAEEAAPPQELSMPEMQVLLAEQRTQIVQLSEQVEKLTKLAVLHDENISRLDRNIHRIDGDAVITMSVPRAMPAGAKLEAMASNRSIALSAPVPSEATRKTADKALQQGLNARHGSNGVSETPSRASHKDDDARRSFAASQNRARHDGGMSNT